MKSKKYIIIILSVALLVTISFCLYGRTINSGIPKLALPQIGQENHPVEMMFNITDKNIPGNAQVYKYMPMDALSDMKNIAGIFGCAINDFKENIHGDRISYSYMNGDITILYKKDSSWDYHDHFRSKVENPSVPDETEALQIASDFVKKNLNVDTSLYRVSFGKSYRGEGKDDTESIELYKIVTFSAYVGKYKIYGSKLSVGIGDKGKIVAVVNTLKNYEPYKVMELISYDEAIVIAQNDLSQMAIDNEAIKVIFNKIELAYWGDPTVIQKQPYLQPVYVFLGTQELSNGETKAISTIVPAIKY